MKSIAIKILLLSIAMLLLIACVNKDTPAEKNQADSGNWIVLFDGSSTEQWRDTKSELFPEHGWLVLGNVLTVLGKTDEQPGGHDIISKQKYSSFELELEVNLSEGANSGIKYIVTDSFPGNEGKYLGLEYQLLDNERHPDAQMGRDGNHKMAALYDLIPPPDSLQINPPGEWNSVRIIVDGNKVEHWLNGVKVLEFDRKSEDFRKLVGLSKYKDLEHFGEQDMGYILLQGHGNDVSFRNIKIRTW